MRHQQKISFMAVTLFLFSGCVAKDEYLKKQAEVDSLHLEITQALGTNNNLLTEKEKTGAKNRALQSELETVRAENSALKSQLQKITAEYQELSDKKDAIETNELAYRHEAEAQIEKLRRQNLELVADKQMLNESIALLKKNAEEKVMKVSGTYESLLQKMGKEIEQGQITITKLKGKLTLSVLDKILFDSGKTNIKEQGLDVLNRVVEILATTRNNLISIEGHTDNVRIGGALAKKYPTNWELSAARALTVVHYLEKQGIDPKVLSAVAFGENRPVADNETAAGRAKNRRITIVLKENDEAPE